jgi:WD40 repeat protein
MGAPIDSLAFSPDGRTLASATVGAVNGVSTWEVDTGRLTRALPDPRWPLPEDYSGTHDVAFSPEGNTLAACGHRAIVLWERSTGRLIHVLRGQQGGIFHLAFAADGSRLASVGGDRTLRIWQMATGKEIRRFELPQSGLRSAALSPDGATLASGLKDGTIGLWDVASGKETRRLPGGGLALINAFGSDGKTVTSLNGAGSATMWEIATGRQVWRTRLERWAPSRTIVLSADQRTAASAGADGVLRVWAVATGRMIRRIRLEPWNIPRCIATSPDGKTLAAASDAIDTTFQVWDTDSGNEKFFYPRHRGQVLSVAFSSDDKMVVSLGSDGTLRLWDPVTGKETRRLQDGPRSLWDGSLEEERRHLLLAKAGPSWLLLSPDGRGVLSLGREGRLAFWDQASGRLVRETPLQDCGRVFAVALSPDGQTFSAITDDTGTLTLWTVATGKEKQRAKLHLDMAHRTVAFAPDGKTVATGGDYGRVLLWDSATLRVVDRLAEPVGSVKDVAFSPDGKLICAGGTDGILRVLRRGVGEIQRSPDPEDGTERIIRTVAFSPSGKRIAWAGDDQVVRIWDLDKRQNIAEFRGHEGGVIRVAFSRSARFVASGSDDGTILIWDLAGFRE